MAEAAVGAPTEGVTAERGLTGLVPPLPPADAAAALRDLRCRNSSALLSRAPNAFGTSEGEVGGEAEGEAAAAVAAASSLKAQKEAR